MSSMAYKAKADNYNPLNLKALKNKEHSVVSTKEALADVIPIGWGVGVVNGDKKVLLVDKTIPRS